MKQSAVWLKTRSASSGACWPIANRETSRRSRSMPWRQSSLNGRSSPGCTAPNFHSKRAPRITNNEGRLSDAQGEDRVHDWSGQRLTRAAGPSRSEEHTSELQSLAYLVCRLLLEKKKETGDNLHSE